MAEATLKVLKEKLHTLKQVEKAMIGMVEGSKEHWEFHSLKKDLLWDIDRMSKVLHLFPEDVAKLKTEIP